MTRRVLLALLGTVLPDLGLPYAAPADRRVRGWTDQLLRSGVSAAGRAFRSTLWTSNVTRCPAARLRRLRSAPTPVLAPCEGAARAITRQTATRYTQAEA